MKDYPEKTCDIDRLIRHPKLIAAAENGNKTQQRRDGIYAYPGESWRLNTTDFVITAVKRQTLGEMTNLDAQAEGYPDLETYKKTILSMHNGMEWNSKHKVWVHHFAKKTDQNG